MHPRKAATAATLSDLAKQVARHEARIRELEALVKKQAFALELHGLALVRLLDRMREEDGDRADPLGPFPSMSFVD
jgi:hypothetical protein